MRFNGTDQPSVLRYLHSTFARWGTLARLLVFIFLLLLVGAFASAAVLVGVVFHATERTLGGLSRLCVRRALSRCRGGLGARVLMSTLALVLALVFSIRVWRLVRSRLLNFLLAPCLNRGEKRVGVLECCQTW